MTPSRPPSQKEIARALHDSVTQDVAAASLLAGVADRLAENPAEVRAVLSSLRERLHAAEESTRAMIATLRGEGEPILAAGTLAEAMSVAVSQVQERWPDLNVSVDVRSRTDGRPLRTAAVQAVMYITIEALQNAAKHAVGAHVHVTGDLNDDTLTVQIADTGPGTDQPPDDSHYGLIGMREWAGRADGKLIWSSRPGEGTRVQVTIAQPLQPPPPDSSNTFSPMLPAQN